MKSYALMAFLSFLNLRLSFTTENGLGKPFKSKDSDWNTSCAMWSLTGKPNKNVNFVTGVNCSGKSSLLQGLVLGLLADSKHTKRYHKLQDFIQKGYNRATVQVE